MLQAFVQRVSWSLSCPVSEARDLDTDRRMDLSRVAFTGGVMRFAQPLQCYCHTGLGRRREPVKVVRLSVWSPEGGISLGRLLKGIQRHLGPYECNHRFFEGICVDNAGQYQVAWGS